MPFFILIKGIVEQKILSLKSHILGSYGVCSFWSEGSIHPLNLKMLVPDFVPRDLEWRCTWSLHAVIRGTIHSRSLETKPGTKMFKLRGLIDPSDQNEQCHTPLLSKIWDLIERKLIVGLSLLGLYSVHLKHNVCAEENDDLSKKHLTKMLAIIAPAP